MFSLFTLPSMQAALGGGAAGAGGNSGILQILMFVLIFVVFWFFLIRPQKKKQKETEAMIAAVKKNDKVTTIGGIKGVVSSVKEKTVVLKVDENTKMEFNKSAISSVDTKESEVEKK